MLILPKNFKLMKILTSFFILLSTMSFGQTLLDSVDLNMLSGERINDVEYIPEMQAYIVVGHFTSILGQPRNSVAFLDEDFGLLPNELIPSGTFLYDCSPGITINSVAYAKKRNPILSVGPSLTTTPIPLSNPIYHYIFLGGAFGCYDSAYVSNSNLMFFCFQGSTLSQSSQFHLISHEELSDGAVYDLSFFSDTLHVAGNTTSYKVGGTVYNHNGYGLFRLRPGLSDLIEPLPPLTTVQFFNARSILRHNNIFYVGAYGDINNPKEFNSSWLQNTNFSPFNGVSALPQIGELFSINDTLIGHIYREGGAGVESLKLNSTTGFQPGGYSSTWYNPFPETYSANSYNKDLFSLEKAHSDPTPKLLRKELTGAIFGGSSSLTFNTIKSVEIGQSAFFPEDLKKNMIIAKNRLILSHDKISSVDGIPRQNVAIFCLEPKDPQPFSQADTTICFGDTSVYTIPASQYAEAYVWEYSGSGARYRRVGALGPYEVLDSVSLDVLSGSANSIEIIFGPETTAGVLSVQPFNTCNNSTDYLFARKQTINLIIPPLPTIEMEDTLAFTCLVDTLDLHINTTTPNVTFTWEWNDSLQNITNDSIQLANTDIIGATTFYGIVREPIEGCQSIDSTYVYFNTTPPGISQTDVVQNPNPFRCFDNSVAVDLPWSNAVTQWRIGGDTINLLPSPLEVFSFDTSSVTAIVTDTINGCSSQQQYEIVISDSTLSGVVNGIAIQSGVILDSLDCNTPTLTLNAMTTPINGSASWIVDGANIGNVLNLSEADTVGMSNSIKVYTLETYNDSNGCTKIEDVIIKFNFEKPFVVEERDSSLNCSQNTVTLTHTPTFGVSQQGWLNNVNTNTFNDTLLVSQAGQYTYEVVGMNGCTNYDTVQVVESNELLLNLIEDTLVCPEEIVSVNVMSVNNNDPTTYTWSNGAVGQSVQATGGQDSFLAVEAITSTGCVGQDTVIINITPPVEVEFINTANCSNNAISITSISGGAGNFSFAIDSGSWQTDAFFDSLDYGNYIISVQDDLGCIYNFNHTIESAVETPDINFLASTYNGEGDTLAIVNISTFTGFDSLNWVLPSQASIFSESDSMVIVSLPSEGWYEIQLKGYIDTCSYSIRKSLYFGGAGVVYDSTGYNAGIQNINLYPNPTNGQFTLTFDMSVQQNYSVVVTNVNGQPIPSMTQSGLGGDVELNFNFPIGTPNGSYKIHIIADFDANHKTIILNN